MIITGLTAARMIAIEAASVVSGAVVGNNLILTKHDGSTINAGNVRGAQGVPGDVDRASVQTITGAKTFSTKVTIGLSTNGSALRIGGGGNADSLNIDAYGASAATLASGSDFDGTNSTARATSSAQVEMINGVFNFYMDTGLTPGSTYTRTQRVSFDNAGRVSINRATAGMSLLISEQAASLEGGSVFISRSSAAANVQSLVFGASVASDYIIGRSAGSDHLKLGTSTGGGAFATKIQFDTNGGISALGSLNLFGGGAFGADQSAVGIGQYDADDALISTYQPIRANCAIIIQSKGTGAVILRNGGNTSKYLILDSNGKVTMTIGATGISSDGLEVNGSPNSTFAVIKGITAWGVGAGGDLLRFTNGIGNVISIDSNGQLVWGSGANIAGIFVASATAGGGAAVPATVAGFMLINVNGTIRKIPYFAN